MDADFAIDLSCVSAFVGDSAYFLMARRSQHCLAEDDATMATDNMSERLTRVETAVKNLDEKVKNVDERVKNLDEKFDQKITDLDSKVNQLANNNKIQFEQLREDIKKLGEGYESGLKRISKQVSNLDKRWAEKWSLRDLAIRDHGKRIAALEGRPRR